MSWECVNPDRGEENGGGTESSLGRCGGRQLREVGTVDGRTARREDGDLGRGQWVAFFRFWFDWGGRRRLKLVGPLGGPGRFF